MENFIYRFQETIKSCWNQPVSVEARRPDETFGELAAKIAMMNITLQRAGLQPGDKIAIKAKSCADWRDAFLGSMCGGYVNVLMTSETSAQDTIDLVNQSNCRILFIDAESFKSINPENMDHLIGVIDINTMKCLAGTEEFLDAFCNKSRYYKAKYPKGIKPQKVYYPIRESEDVCTIVYTEENKKEVYRIQNFSEDLNDLSSKFPFNILSKLKTVSVPASQIACEI